MEIKKTFQSRRKLSYNKKKQEKLFSATLSKTVNITNKQNPEEISSKHGDSPNSLRKPDSVIEAISLMTKQLVSSIVTLNSSMDHSFTEMKETLGNLAYVEESADEEGSVNSDAEKETDKAPNKDSASTKDQNLLGSSNAYNVNNQLTLTNDTNPTDPESFKEENSTLAGIASNLKLGQKKAPAVNAQFAGILKEVMRVKLDDDVLTETKNRYTRPENCECLEPTQVNYLIWDKLKPDTRSSDLKLQRVQANLLKGIIPVVGVVEQLVKVQEKISEELLDIPSLIRTATDPVAFLGAANLQRRDNIKQELNADYKHLCSPTVPLTGFLFGDDPDLSRQLKDLAEATKVSKKISKNS